jgi:hypothetical protein
MPSYESSMRNLARAQEKWRPPRPFRSDQETLMIRRLVFQWFTCRNQRPSGRAWARDLGISHTWLQKLVREFATDSTNMWQLQARKGDPQIEELTRARAYSSEMERRGELRSSRGAKWPKFL